MKLTLRPSATSTNGAYLSQPQINNLYTELSSALRTVRRLSEQAAYDKVGLRAYRCRVRNEVRGKIEGAEETKKIKRVYVQLHMELAYLERNNPKRHKEALSASAAVLWKISRPK